MKGCAKFLNFIALLVFLLTILGLITLCAGAAVFCFKLDAVSEPILEALEPYTYKGQPITMQTLTEFRVPVLIIFGAFILILLFTLFTIAKIRTALKEVGQGEPFSVRCSKALNSAAILEIITGVIGIALSIYSTYLFSGASTGGGMAGGISLNLSFILTAIFLKMLAGISEFGRR